jgi:cation:H+ antiporter
MAFQVGLVLLGFLLLYFGGEGLVRGASGIALLARISPAVVALTIVAAGTSMPELVVSVQAAWMGNSGLSLGNVLGSNLFNATVIIGLAALFWPLRVQSASIRMEWPVMMLATLQVWLLSRDGKIDAVEGAFLLFAVVLFTAYASWIGRKEGSKNERDEEELETASFGRTGGAAVALNLLALAGGVALLIAGSTALVKGSVALAQAWGVSDTLIGLTIVAVGTSSPEMITSLIAASKGRDEIAIGNVIGSNIFNLLGILGASSVIHPLEVESSILSNDFPWLIGISLLLFPLMRSGMKIQRAEGALLLAVYGVFLALRIREAVAP